MIKSMTAYSRASSSSPIGKFVVEIHSVNRKMLDMSLHLPREFLRFDIEMRKWLSKSLERGQVTLRLSLQSEGTNVNAFSNTLEQLKALKLTWEKLCTELGYDAQRMIDLPFLVNQMLPASSIENKGDEEAIKAALKDAIDVALKDLMQMKEAEGKALCTDILNRLKTIEENISAVEQKKELPLLHFQRKIEERLKEFGLLQAEMEERVVREVALLADRMDVTEELVRLCAHIEQFRLHLASPEKAIGRTLDFLTQEMHREINTLGSKSCDSEISLFVVKIKSELDKIREQVQNIE